MKFNTFKVQWKSLSYKINNKKQVKPRKPRSLVEAHNENLDLSKGKLQQGHNYLES
jgi:hypothetical protein